MSAERFEAFLAQLYVDEQARRRFLTDPRAEASVAGLTEEQCTALESVDTVGLQLAADSFARKRESHKPIARQGKFSRWFNAR